jgi:uncharacterized membrane protein (DUF4010 family)
VSSPWIKPALTIAALGLLAWLLPGVPLDPWHLFRPNEVARMIFVLALIQGVGVFAARFFGTRAGAIFTGFTGGLISSTATTASLARRSKTRPDSARSSDILVFLSATGAMLIEGMGLAMSGARTWNASVALVFMGPLLVTGALILFQYKKLDSVQDSAEPSEFVILPLLKLAVFIVLILTLSRVLQGFFGENGLLTLTFLVSLFEIHGSVIANLQLNDSGAISNVILIRLLAISIVASYLSKLFLVSTLGHARLKRQAIVSTAVLFLSLLMSWGVARFAFS